MADPTVFALDSFALLSYLQDEPVASRIEKLLENARKGKRRLLLSMTPERITTIRTFVADNLTDLDEMSQRLPLPVLFFHNARTTVVFLLLGLLSFSTLGLALFMGNMGLVGGVMGAASR